MIIYLRCTPQLHGIPLQSGGRFKPQTDDIASERLSIDVPAATWAWKPKGRSATGTLIIRKGGRTLSKYKGQLGDGRCSGGGG